MAKREDFSTTYDPTIQAHLQRARERWERRAENVESLIKYGIPFLDKRLFGLNTMDGELVLVIGEEKQRKTTLAINIVINILTQTDPQHMPYIVIDSLESGMPPERYTDQLVSNLASRYLMDMGHTPVSHGRCTMCGSPACKELAITPEFLMYLSRSTAQRKVIDRAYDEIMSWPLDIWGAGIGQGDTRNLMAAVGKLDRSSRWVWAVEEKGANIFIDDHVQQYSFNDMTLGDYEKLSRSVSAVGAFVAAYRTAVLLLSQISLTSIREAKGGGKVTATGGRKPHQEANTILKASYEKDSGEMGISIEDSRKSGAGFTTLPMDDISGALMEKIEYGK